MSEADTELLAAIARVVAAFEALDVDYLVGGSVASSLFGEPRQTVNADLVARPEQMRDSAGAKSELFRCVLANHPCQYFTRTTPA